jgi:hypothetical protein
MALPIPTPSEILLTKSARLRRDNPQISPKDAIDRVCAENPQVWAQYLRSWSTGVDTRDTLRQLEKAATAQREAADDNPCVEVVRRATLLRMEDPSLSDDEAFRRVFADDPDLLERYRTRDVKRHQWPVVEDGGAPRTTADVMRMAKAMVRKQAGMTTHEALAKLVQDHPREATFLETYRQFHLNEGLDEHHGGTAAAPRMRTAYDIMSSGSHA